VAGVSLPLIPTQQKLRLLFSQKGEKGFFEIERFFLSTKPPGDESPGSGKIQTPKLPPAVLQG
jgi:hypothetical protein